VAGRGTYPVAEQDRYVSHFGSVEELMALSLDTECEVVSSLQRKVDVETASRLRLSSDEICTVTLVAAAELAVSYFDPEHYSYRVKLRRRSR
jgi:hypothetical protein